MTPTRTPTTASAGASTSTGTGTGDDTDGTKKVTLVQHDAPPLRTGVYTMKATGTVPGQTPGTFPASARFIVQGERFSLADADIAGVFPPSLATGEFDGSLPHVVLSRLTLPWERSLRNGDPKYADYPWLAVLLFDDATAPKPEKKTAADLVPDGTPITVIDVRDGTPITMIEGELAQPPTGKLPAHHLSYGTDTLLPLGYGEAATDDCLVLDIDLDTFNGLAPSANDLLYLAHIREVDVTDGVDADTTTTQVAVVVGNRIPSLNSPMRAFLVSLENMAAVLPGDDGTPSSAIPVGTTHVRLLVYTSWTFTADTLDQNLESLLTHLNTVPANSPTTLRLPIVGDAPTPPQVKQAAANQATAAKTDGKLAPQDAEVIVQNALVMGYVPLDHHLRHGGSTVSWYRGPLVPYPVTTTIAVPISGPDAAARYDPQAGMFDVSYAAAWELGQLLAVQNSAVANAIYTWKHQVRQQDAAADEQELLRGLLTDGSVLSSFVDARDAALDPGPPPLPPDVVTWLGALGRLEGVPFNYLVPDELMLPPESMRFCYLDLNWVDALVDGAFSIGRSTQPTPTETEHAELVRTAGRAALALPTRRPALTGQGDNPSGQVTALLIRSQAVTGWPNLRFNGFGDLDGHDTVTKLRQVNLAADTVLCLYDGVVELVQVEEPPEQLHLGVEGASGTYWTTLRSVDQPNPGEQLPSTKSVLCNPTSAEAVVCLTMRDDHQTLQVSTAATDITGSLVDDYHQKLVDGFTSAEFALELNQGVLIVEFKATNPAPSAKEGRP